MTYPTVPEPERSPLDDLFRPLPHVAELKIRWEVLSALQGSEALAGLLANDWEPFSVTVRDGQVPTVWLRKQVVGG